ncbi:hypothetical protein [Kordia sp.]|uniref:hypothetical protein n=1 Tax=Kordia sp. TaxID=1965332 RepID=UPI003D6A34DC
MKKIYLGLLVAIITFCTSCEFSETIYINEDGSGKMSLYFDGSEIMQMAGSQITGGREESIDSMISFKELFSKQKLDMSKLSKEEKKQLESLNRLNMHMVMDTKKSKMNLDVFMDFDNINNLQETYDGLNKLAEMSKQYGGMGNSNPLAGINPEEITSMKYSYKNNVFKRAFSVLDKKMIDSLKGNLGQAEMILASSSYKLDYHFPRKIKSVSLKDAVIGKDGKSFTVEINFMEFLDNPEVLNVEVELEK